MIQKAASREDCSLGVVALALVFPSKLLRLASEDQAVKTFPPEVAAAASVRRCIGRRDFSRILPRISGQLGYRPCRASEEEESFTFPWTWKEVTRE
jgi:hypothetical protein